MDITKMNSIIFFKKNEKSWILKTDYGEHLLNFSDFLKFSHRFNCLKNTSSCSSLAKQLYYYVVYLFYCITIDQFLIQMTRKK